MHHTHKVKGLIFFFILVLAAALSSGPGSGSRACLAAEPLAPAAPVQETTQAQAQETPPGNAEQEIIAPYISSAPKIDGVFEEEIYRNFWTNNQFTQMIPNYGETASEDTQVFIAYDDENLYVTYKAYYKNPKIIRTSITKRDKFDNNDFILFIMDPFLSRIKGNMFSVNPHGIQKDSIYDEVPGNTRYDYTWDALYYSAGKIYDWGYLVEVRIPFKSLRFPAGKDQQRWGLHLMRWIASKSEYDTMFYIDRSKRGWLPQQAILVINKNIKPSLHMELVPSFTTLVNKGEDADPEFGASFKYNLASDTTIDLAYNPDFSHIEADTGQININQRYALYYEEKRPFFLESKEIFRTPVELFYSRRIASPRFGAKLTGRSGRSSFGLVSAYDTGSFSDLFNVVEGGGEEAWTNLFRYKYEIARGNYLGLFVTDKRWSDDYFNNVLALDAHFSHNGLMGDFQVLRSNSRMEEKNSGEAYYGLLSYENKHIRANFLTEHYGPSFDAQLGFIRRSDMRRYRSYLEYVFLPDKKYFVNGGPLISYDFITDWQGETMDKQLKVGFTVMSDKYTNIMAFWNQHYEKFSGLGFDKNFYEFQVTSFPFKFFTLGYYHMFGDSLFYSSEPFLGYNRIHEFWSTLNPTNRFSLSPIFLSSYFYTRKGGDLVYKMNIYRIKALYFFTQRLSLRAIWEYNSYYDKHFGNILLSYEYNPSTVFYLGYSTDRIYDNGLLVDDTYSIFLKISYLFRK